MNVALDEVPEDLLHTADVVYSPLNERHLRSFRAAAQDCARARALGDTAPANANRRAAPLRRGKNRRGPRTRPGR